MLSHKTDPGVATDRGAGLGDHGQEVPPISLQIFHSGGGRFSAIFGRFSSTPISAKFQSSRIFKKCELGHFPVTQKFSRNFLAHPRQPSVYGRPLRTKPTRTRAGPGAGGWQPRNETED